MWYPTHSWQVALQVSKPARTQSHNQCPWAGVVESHILPQDMSNPPRPMCVPGPIHTHPPMRHHAGVGLPLTPKIQAPWCCARNLNQCKPCGNNDQPLANGNVRSILETLATNVAQPVARDVTKIQSRREGLLPKSYNLWKIMGSTVGPNGSHKVCHGLAR